MESSSPASLGLRIDYLHPARALYGELARCIQPLLENVGSSKDYGGIRIVAQEGTGPWLTLRA